MVQMDFHDAARGRGAVDHPHRHTKLSVRKPRFTPNQAMVYHALLGFGRAAKAYELLEALRPQGVSTPPTIYRALSELEKKNLVRPIHCTRTFTARPIDQPFTKNSILIICEACGHVETFENQNLQYALNENVNSAGFTPREKVVEILALCPEDKCPASQAEKANG